MPATIVVANLLKRYGDLVAASAVSFDVGEREIFGLLGPNGAGKTTVLECVLGLRRPDEGSIQICGLDAGTHARQIKQRVGAQLQATNLADKITPCEAIRLFGAFYRRRATPRQLLERFALAKKADVPFDTLSAGQRQRLALALAFVNEPEVVFLDEPTAGLDPQSRRDLHESITEMRRQGYTVVLSTHDMEEAQSLCDRVAIIDHGKIIVTGTPSQLIERARTGPRIILRTARPLTQAWLQSLAGVREAHLQHDRWEIVAAEIGRTISELALALHAAGNEVTDLHIQRPSLEDVFIELTGRDALEELSHP